MHKFHAHINFAVPSATRGESEINMDILYKFIVSFIAGIGAGLGTGFAGMSAAAVISPVLITFLDMSAYQAVGIALASDILASAVSTMQYWKNKNIDLILCGHMHGGLVPKFMRHQDHGGGIVGPYASILPKHSYGVIEDENTISLTSA